MPVRLTPKDTTRHGCALAGQPHDKFILYRTLASLREHVLIDPSKRHVEVLTPSPPRPVGIVADTFALHFDRCMCKFQQ